MQYNDNLNSRSVNYRQNNFNNGPGPNVNAQGKQLYFERSKSRNRGNRTGPQPPYNNPQGVSIIMLYESNKSFYIHNMTILNYSTKTLNLIILSSFYKNTNK